jgi:hypothetical protein
MLSDENNFRTIRESCPGINQKIAYEKFCNILTELMEKQAKIHC